MAPAPYEQVMEDMLKGRSFAQQLQALLQHSPEAGHIIDQILRSFSCAIEATKAAASAGSEEGSEVQSEVTCAGGGKRKAVAGGGKDRRSASRRRNQQSSVVTVMRKDMEDDGHAWRKYGQKEIQNSKHPKAYFRCTHKYDQHCAAQRQVQRCDDDPASYRVTYIGKHTCRDPATVAPLVVHHHAGADGDTLHAGSRLISFAPNASTTTASTTTSTTTTAAGDNAFYHQQANREDAAPLESGSGPRRDLKLEGCGDQEEVLSSLTPAGSSAATEAAAVRNAVATPGPDQGDVTSGLQSGIDKMFFPMDDDTFDLEDLLRFC